MRRRKQSRVTKSSQICAERQRDTVAQRVAEVRLAPRGQQAAVACAAHPRGSRQAGRAPQDIRVRKRVRGIRVRVPGARGKARVLRKIRVRVKRVPGRLANRVRADKQVHKPERALAGCGASGREHVRRNRRVRMLLTKPATRANVAQVHPLRTAFAIKIAPPLLRVIFAGHK